MTPLVIIIMGSPKDEGYAKKITQKLDELGLEYVCRISSAHKTVEHLMHLVSEYEKMERDKVYITIAGRSNGLSGVVDGLTSSPTIACPPPSDSFSGLDILSSLRMPEGICPAVVLEPTNAALLVARILSLVDSSVKANLESYRNRQKNIVIESDTRLSNSLT